MPPVNKMGYQHSTKWSHVAYNFQGTERWMDKIVKHAYAAENDEDRRIMKLRDFNTQRKRGIPLDQWNATTSDQSMSVANVRPGALQPVSVSAKNQFNVRTGQSAQPVKQSQANT